jgi:hypothetical protein
VFGRREVFQLAPGKRRAGDSAMPEEYLGRLIGVERLSYSTLDERSRQGWRVRGAHSGELVESAVESDLFIPMVRVDDERMAFLCHNDPLPTTGDVIGLASPSLQKQLDDDIAANDDTNPTGAERDT